VTDRWVCKRCFSNNDASAGACERCGLLRGSEVADADRDAWANATGTPVPGTAAKPGWQRFLRFWWVPVAVIVLGVGWFTTARRGDDGAVTAAGTLSVTDLRVGDCFSTDGATEIADVDAVPCTEPHTFEVFGVHTYEGALPLTDASSEAVFRDLCEADFEAYVGAPYDTSAIYGSMISPSEETYADGDREYLCILFEPDPANFSEDLVLTESLRGAAR
jgi:hypothetical protein